MSLSEQLSSKLNMAIAAAGLTIPAEWFVQNEAKLWPAHFPQDRQMAVQAAIAAVDLVLPEWRAGHPKDTAPIRAVEAARALPEVTSGPLHKHAMALAKACTTSRRKTLGYIAEAARAVVKASASQSESDAFEAVSEALAKVEDHIRLRFAIKAQYGKEHEIRADMLSQILPVFAASQD